MSEVVTVIGWVIIIAFLIFFGLAVISFIWFDPIDSDKNKQYKRRGKVRKC